MGLVVQPMNWESGRGDTQGPGRQAHSTNAARERGQRARLMEGRDSQTRVTKFGRREGGPEPFLEK